MIFLIGLLIIIIDLSLKAYVSINFMYGASFGNIIKITNISNDGIAYGLRRK